ncbi:MAG: hypothetical protein KJO79_08585 [Verrucomicrobiae bacterium]|nr:hypothetical protein [Verrucomicrobiae bacterium]NNJ87223.1 hypothetical protein [Akkermansiaceae bacterium]
MVLLLFAAIDNSCAQGTGVGTGSDSLLPPAPQGNVLDEADLFREAPEKLATIQASLAEMEKKHAYPVYLAIYYSVYDGNLQARAEALRKAWIGEMSRGMVIVYQLDPVVSGNNPAIAYYKGSELHSDLSAGPMQQLISGQEVESMLTRVFAGIKAKKGAHVPFISEVVLGVEKEINRYHEVKPTSWSDEDNLKLMFVFLGIIAVLALLGVFLWKLIVRADAKSSMVHYFPTVKISRRLEAPYGGGWTSEKTFVPASSRR